MHFFVKTRRGLWLSATVVAVAAAAAFGQAGEHQPAQAANSGNPFLTETVKNALNKVMRHTHGNWDDGRSYKGQISNGKLNGFGIYRRKESYYYMGAWSDGQFNGYGAYIVSDGSHVTNCANGAVYVGNWSNGKKTGTGTCYDHNGNLQYTGNFSGDRPIGTYPTTGNYSSYKFKSIDANGGDLYIGETNNDKRHGYGAYVWANGDIWFGSWKNGERNGGGIYILHDASLWKTMNCYGDNCTRVASSEDSKISSAPAYEQESSYSGYQQQAPSSNWADALISGLNAAATIMNAAAQNYQGGGANNYNNGNSYNSNSYGNADESGGGANCSSYQTRYDNIKRNLEREKSSNNTRNNSARFRKATANSDDMMPVSAGDYHQINQSSARVRQYERDMDRVDREAKGVGCRINKY